MTRLWRVGAWKGAAALMAVDGNAVDDADEGGDTDSLCLGAQDAARFAADASLDAE